LIVSLANPEKPVLNAFNIRNGNIESLFLKIVPDKTLQYQ
jgi:hypothetical protein